MTRPGEFSPATVQLIWDRDRGMCAMPGCQNPVLVRERRAEPIRGWSVQHREARGSGGVKRNSDRPHLIRASNGVLLCGTGTTGCHGNVEHHRDNVDPEWGFSVSRLGQARPAEVPLFHALFGWVRLDDAGGWETAEGSTSLGVEPLFDGPDAVEHLEQEFAGDFGRDAGDAREQVADLDVFHHAADRSQGMRR